MAPSSAADPPAGPESPTGSLADAGARLESALARLEALVEAGPLQSELFRAGGGGARQDRRTADAATEALRADLTAALERERALQAQAAAASEALGRAMDQVREVLEVDGGAQDVDADADVRALDLELATAEDSRP